MTVHLDGNGTVTERFCVVIHTSLHLLQQRLACPWSFAGHSWILAHLQQPLVQTWLHWRKCVQLSLSCL